METLVIELTNDKAYRLIRDMEELKLIRVLKEPAKISQLRHKIRTSMTEEDIDKQLNAIRKEWERNIWQFF